MSTTSRIPPGPPGHFLIGNTLQMLREPFDFPVRCFRDYGDVVRLRLGRMVFYLLSDPDAIEQVLRRDHRNFIKDQGTRLLSSFLGEGLLTSEGEVWRRQRRLAQPAFQFDQIPKYADVMTAFTERMLEDWRPGQTRDVHADMARLTMEIAARVFLGTSVGDSVDRVSRAMAVIMEHFAGWQALLPSLGWLPTPGNLRYRRACRDLNAVVKQRIAQRRAGGATEGDDLLSRLLTARDEDGSQMTDQQLRDELVTLFLAGHETTALALSFCFHLLAQHPAVEARLMGELDAVLRGQAPAAVHVPQLRYTEWVVKESMRLYPPAPSIGREAICDCEVAGYHVPRGTQLAPVQWVVHRDGRWFDDPEAFRPERWDNDLARRLPRCAYFPFGDGPRICIGNNFAMMEAILVLATVLRRVRLTTAPGYVLELMPSITLRPRHGVTMMVCERPAAPLAPPIVAGFGIQATPSANLRE
jgi:cytochrome P450